jgi:hypothetical protein
LLCMFRSVYSVYCLCVNVYCTAATQLQLKINNNNNNNNNNNFIVCRVFLSSLTPCNNFSHDRSNWPSPAPHLKLLKAILTLSEVL